MTELKPCPFCGVTGEILSDGKREWALFEHKESCLFPNVHKHEISAGDFAAWNTRAERTCQMYRDEEGVWHCKSCEKGADKTTGSSGMLDGWCDSWHPNYCPNCGTRIKEDTDA